MTKERESEDRSKPVILRDSRLISHPSFFLVQREKVYHRDRPRCRDRDRGLSVWTVQRSRSPRRGRESEVIVPEERNKGVQNPLNHPGRKQFKHQWGEREPMRKSRRSYKY